MNGFRDGMTLSQEDPVNLALSIANIGLWDWDLVTNSVFFSNEWKRQLGYSEGELRNHYNEWESRLHPEDRERVLNQVRNYLAQPNDHYHVEMRLRHKDGSYRWILAQGTLVDNGQGHRRLIGSHLDVTETKNVVQAFNRIEQLFRKMFNESLAVMLLIDLDARKIVDANKAAVRFYGWSYEQLCSMTVDQINTLPEPLIVQELESARRQEQNHFYFKHRLRDGSIRDVEIFSSKVEWEGIELLHSIIHDITEQKRSEQALLESERKYRLITENAEDWVYLTDQDGRFIYNSPSCERLLGYSSDEFVHNPDLILSITHPDDRKTMQLHYQECPEPVTNHKMEFRVITKEGTERCLLHTCHPVYSESGVYLGRKGTNRDITLQKEAEAALKESEERFRRMVEGAPDPIFIQTGGCFVYLNQKALNFMGASSQEELTGRLVVDLVHPDFREVVVNRIRELMEQNAPIRYPLEIKMVRLDGREAWVETTGEVIQYMGREGLLVFARDISDRKMKDLALQTERERLANIIEGTRAGTWEWNVQTGAVVFNDFWAQMAGYTLEELAPVSIDTWAQLAHPDDLKNSEALLARHFNGELDFYECEARIRHKAGHWIWVLDRGKVMSRTPDGKPLLMSGTHQNITETRETRMELEHMHQLMQYIIEHDRSAVAVHDRDLNYIYVSQRYLDIYEVKEHNILGKNHYQVFPDIPDKWKVVHQKALQGEVLSSEEDLFERADGSNYWTRWECRPWYTADGSVGGIIVYTEVINERKQKELEIKKLNSRLEQLIETVKALASALTSEAVEKIVLSAARELTEADGTTFVLADKGQCYYADEEAIAPLWKGKRFPMESCISGWTMMHQRTAMIEDIYSDQRIPIEVYKPTFVKSLLMVPIHPSQPYGAIGVYWKTKHLANDLEVRLIETLADATARTLENIKLYSELEDRVKERTGQLEAVNKELETFTYSVSHDLKAPLRGIDGYSKLLYDLHRGSLNDEAQFFISTIRKATLQMNQLIDDLLEYSRLERSQMLQEPLQIKALVDSVFVSFESDLTNKNIRVINELPEIPVKADIKGLTIVLRNLIENAIKFSNNQGDAFIRIGLVENPGAWQICIQDNGIGFEMKYGQRIFEIFQRLHRAEEYPGTGIGLAMVSKAMHRMNGKVWAESEPGKGTRFYFELPKE